jgi:hypothetical protein
MRKESDKQSQKEEVDRGFVSSRVRSGNSSSQEPWLPPDIKALRVSDEEILADVTIDLSIAAREPDEWVRQFLNAEELAATRGDTLRQIKIWSPFVDRNSLARMLLYCWHSCLGSEFSTVKEEIDELRRVLKSQGFSKPSDINQRVGRPPGNLMPKNRVRLERFMQIREESPDLSPELIALKVADYEIRGGYSDRRKREIQTEVKRFIQRHLKRQKLLTDNETPSRK